MPGGSRLSARFGSDTTDFKNGIREINREMLVVKTRFDATSATMADWSNESQGLEARLEMLNRTIELQREKTEGTRLQLENMKKEHGENSIEAQKAEIAFNQEATKLGKLQTELGQTTKSLNTLKSSSGGMRGAFKDLGTQVSALGTQVPALGTAMSLLSNPITIAVAGMAAFTAGTKKSIKEVVDYNKQIREMKDYIGLSAEETSRIVQVGDDWGIEIGTLRNALEQMNKKGISPSIENLARIADEFVASRDKAAFAEEANKKYGRSFSDLIPIIKQGGDSLREQAAAINEHMLATDESIEAGRQYEVTMDNLGDAVKTLELALGTKFLPTVTKVIDAIGDLTWANIQSADAYTTLHKLHKQGLITEKDLVNATRDLRFGTKSAEEVLKEYAEQVAKLNGIEAYNVQIEREEAIRRGRLNEVTQEGTEALEEQARAAEAAAQAIQDKLNQALSDLNDVVNGQLGPAEEDFITKQDEIKTKMGEIQTEIDKAISQGYSPLGEKILGLQGQYDDLKTQYDENATAHEEATKRILFGILTQQAAVGGLTDNEMNLLDQIALSWGLVDQATVDAKNKAMEAMDYVNRSGDFEGAQKIIEGQETAWSLAKKEALLARDAIGDYLLKLGELDGKVVNTYINEWITTQREGGERHRQHGGIDFVTKPTLFLAGEPGTGGEWVITIPQNLGNSLNALQQMINQSIKQINIQVPYGSSMENRFSGRQLASGSPIQIILQGTPKEEIDQRRQARFIAEEIHRMSS